MSNPTHGTVFADDRVESHYGSLASALTHIVPGHIVPPWSRPIDTIAPEELETPDPTIFPDDLAYLSTTHDEAHLIYLEDLKTHVPPSILAACPNCDKQRYYLDLAKSRGRIGSIASQQCLYELSILCK